MTNDSLTHRATISRVQIARYGAAIGDFNPLHFDDDHARRAGMPGVIGHGMLTLSLSSRAVTDWVGGASERIRSLSMRFRKPVRPGDELTIEVGADAQAEPSPGVEHLVITARCGDIVVASGHACVTVARSKK